MSDYTVTFTDHEITSCDFAGCIKALESAHNWGTAHLLRKIAMECAPRIPEPGLWGVVEAKRYSEPLAVKYLRLYDRNNGGYDWAPINPVDPKRGESFRWSDLIDPTLIRDGLES